eukprot:213009-Rhodomonas_salina.3
MSGADVVYAGVQSSPATTTKWGRRRRRRTKRKRKRKRKESRMRRLCWLWTGRRVESGRRERRHDHVRRGGLAAWTDLRCSLAKAATNAVQDGTQTACRGRGAHSLSLGTLWQQTGSADRISTRSVLAHCRSRQDQQTGSASSSSEADPSHLRADSKRWRRLAQLNACD